MKIRIAVAIDDGEGEWRAFGASGFNHGPNHAAHVATEDLCTDGWSGDRIVWVTAEIPDPAEVVGLVDE